MRKLPLPIVLALIIPLFGIFGMCYFAGSLRQNAIERVVKQSENPSGLKLTLSDLDSKIRRLELERVKLQAIIDAVDNGFNKGNIKLNDKGVGELFGNRTYNVEEVRGQIRTINVQLYGHFYDTIWPSCVSWSNEQWADYAVRWDARKAQTKGVEWAREVESNGWYKEGWYPYQEGYYLKRVRVEQDLRHVMSMSDRMPEKSDWHAPIGNPSAARVSSVPAP